MATFILHGHAHNGLFFPTFQGFLLEIKMSKQNVKINFSFVEYKLFLSSVSDILTCLVPLIYLGPIYWSFEYLLFQKKGIFYSAHARNLSHGNVVTW